VELEIADLSDHLPGEPYLQLLLTSASPRPSSERIRIGEAYRD
jgi:hypothetical protein